MAPVLDLIKDLSTDIFNRAYEDHAAPKPLPLAQREAIADTIAHSTPFDKRDILPTFHTLTARDAEITPLKNPGAGSVDPTSINMKGIQALFALIGVAFCLGIIWFFFWAKNGGFEWRKGDWEDYKSTVLRRKGPNGTTLSNATKSTKLGGGSVVGQGYSDADGSSINGTMTELSSDISFTKEKQSRRSRSKKETKRERKAREARQAEWEGGHDNDVRAYRHEKVARVGGLNTNSEAQHYGTDYSQTDGSDFQGHDQDETPPPPPRHQHQSRSPSRLSQSHIPHQQSYSQTPSQVSSRTHSRAPSQVPSRQPSPEKRQTRRDFSYAPDDGFSSTPQQPPPASRPTRYHSPSKAQSRTNWDASPGGAPPGAYAAASEYSYTYSGSGSDVQSQNTKTYHHPIPGLGTSNKSPHTGGYRRDRRDSFDD